VTTSSREVLPSARRLIGSLRDIGYDLSSSIADLVDNSISAGATTISIDMRFEGADSWIRLADNGCGMSWDQLEEALRFGSRRDYEATELGRYGLGLKLATLSQCRLMTVASRVGAAGRLTIGQWDLEHVEATDRWEILRPSAREIDRLVVEPLDETSGTVVVLDDLDRVLRPGNPKGAWAEQAFERASREVENHLSMAFHRFLSGEAAADQRLTIQFNESQLIPWDPFCRDEPDTISLPERTLSVEDSAARALVRVRPYVLPNEAAFSSPDAHARAAGPRGWNRQQGLYVYRNDRLVQSGGWARLRTPDEHTKLARVAVDFPSALDDQFGLNIAKSQVRLPSVLRDEMAQIVSSVAQLAQRAYRSGYTAPPAERSRLSVANPAPDPRTRALEQLVEMVINACEATLREELGEESLTLRRGVRALRAMKQEFAQDLEAIVTRSRRSASASDSEGVRPSTTVGRLPRARAEPNRSLGVAKLSGQGGREARSL
jgi:hypothetical protein